jgi:hypothetical protein
LHAGKLPKADKCSCIICISAIHGGQPVIVTRLLAPLITLPCGPLRGLKRCAFDQAL